LREIESQRFDEFVCTTKKAVLRVAQRKASMFDGADKKRAVIE